MAKKIALYSTPDCAKCMALKAELVNLEVMMVDMREPSALTELRCGGVFNLQAPVLQVGDNFYTELDLFKHGNVDTKKLRHVLEE